MKNDTIVGTILVILIISLIGGIIYSNINSCDQRKCVKGYTTFIHIYNGKYTTLTPVYHCTEHEEKNESNYTCDDNSN